MIWGWDADFTAFTRPPVSLPGGMHACLPAWRTSVQPLFAAGRKGAALMVIASFAAPLMALVGGVGAVVSVTGVGSTAALRAAASVWGDFEALAFVGPTRAKIEKLEGFRHLPVICSLLRCCPAMEAAEFCEGLVLPMGAWARRTLVLTRSERPVFPVMWPISDAPGVEVPFGRRLSALETADVDGAVAGAGAAGAAYLDYLVDPTVIAWCRKMLVRRYAELHDAGSQTEPHALRALAALSVAAMIVCQLDIIAFDYLALTTWAKEKVLKR